MIRWNLVIFGGQLTLLMIIVTFFAWKMFSKMTISGNDERAMVIVGLFALLSAVVGYVGGYATAVMQALTGPPDPKPKVTESYSLESLRIATGNRGSQKDEE